MVKGSSTFCDKGVGHTGPHSGRPFNGPRASWEDTAICRFCDQPFAPPTRETDLCRHCYYNGATHRENLKAFVEALEAVHPVAVEHTGGGCFWIRASLEDGSAVVFTMAYQDRTGQWQGEGILPETSAGPWYGVHYPDTDCQEDPLREGLPLDLAGAVQFLGLACHPEWTAEEWDHGPDGPDGNAPA